MELFETTDFREIVRLKIEALPNKGYGQLSKLAKHLRISNTLVSQILNGAKSFSEDQAFEVAEFLEFTELESLYFVLLIQHERAGSYKLKDLLKKQIEGMQANAMKIGARVRIEGRLTSEQQAIFYSDWRYTAIHTLTSIEKFQNEDAIIELLRLPKERVEEAIEWLVDNGLCKRTNGKLVIGPKTTFIDKDSHWANRHHLNWRYRGMDKMARKSDRDFFFTAPISLSSADHIIFKKELISLIERLSRRIEKTEPEQMSVISIDLFEE